MYINYFNGSKYDKKYLHTTGTHKKFEILTKNLKKYEKNEFQKQKDFFDF